MLSTENKGYEQNCERIRNANGTSTNVVVFPATTLKLPAFSSKHGKDWTMWDMKIMAHIIE
jgi:hypothetical protein